MNIYHIAAAFVIILALKYLSAILVYMILAIFFTILLAPIFRFFDRYGMPAIAAYFITLAGFVLIFSGVFLIVESSAREFGTNLPFYEERFSNLLEETQKLLHQYQLQLDLSMLKSLDLMGIVKKFLANAGNILKSFLIVVIGVSFLLFESKDFGKKITAVTENPAYFEAFFASVQKYFIIKTLTSFLTGVLVGSMLSFFGVPYAFLFGFLAFLFNYIPVVGSIVAAIPGIVLALITYGIDTALYVTILYLIINISISNVIEPKIMGEGLNLSPAVVFFSLIFWGWMFGIVGTFFAVPLTMTLKLAFESSPKTRWMAQMLSNYSDPKDRNRT